MEPSVVDSPKVVYHGHGTIELSQPPWMMVASDVNGHIADLLRTSPWSVHLLHTLPHER